MDSFVKIAALDNSVEAQLIASILEERRIPHRIRSFHDTAYDGLFQVQKGWGEIYAPRQWRQELSEIIDPARHDQ